MSREYIKGQPLNILIWGHGGVSIKSHPLLTEKNKTPIVVNALAIKALNCRKSNDEKLQAMRIRLGDSLKEVIYDFTSL